MKSTPANYPPIRFPVQEIHELRDELALLKAERDELREALEEILRRYTPCQDGGIDAVKKARAVLANGRLGAIDARPDELRNALEACVERLAASQPPTGGRTEAVINQAKAVLAKGKG